MVWRRLLEKDIQDFIKDNESADIQKLALKKPPVKDWPYRLILDQIKVRKKAKIKINQWLDCEGVVFPSGDIIEQASSWPCAAYKSSIVTAKSFCDLTAGIGIDSYAFSQKCKKGYCVDCNEENVQILSHNFNILKKSKLLKPDSNIEISCAKAEGFVNTMPEVDLIYIDPQRRNSSQKSLYDLSSCRPDIFPLLSRLKAKSRYVMVKASPRLDINKALLALENVKQVHIVQWRGECKEVLYLIDMKNIPNRPFSIEDTLINAVDIDDNGNILKKLGFLIKEEKTAKANFSLPMKYIYEPAPAFMKSAGFLIMAQRYGLYKLHKNTHLYTSDKLVTDFPGKYYIVDKVCSVKKAAREIKTGELVLRNFPGSVQALRSKLKLQENSSFRIFACTTCDNKKRLIICHKEV